MPMATAVQAMPLDATAGQMASMPIATACASGPVPVPVVAGPVVDAHAVVVDGAPGGGSSSMYPNVYAQAEALPSYGAATGGYPGAAYNAKV